ncbi:MAG: nucleotide exchange factor GrpE [Patescibacteria group bacterium]
MGDEDIEIVEEDESLKEKFKKIKDELNACKKEKEEYLAGWQRAKADFINYKKDEEKNREEFAKFASQSILYDFLRVLDSVDIALKHKENNGIKEIKNQFLETLKRHGIEEINASSGERFNPAEHESITESEVEKSDLDGVVIEELQKGYKLFNRVLRPSKVKVGVYKIKD